MKPRFFLFGALLLSCVDDPGANEHASSETGQTTGECAVGGEGCACTAGGTCDEGLMCLADVCQPIECPVGGEGCACTSGGGCDDGLSCVGGTCTPEGNSDSDGGSTTGNTTLGDSEGDSTSDGGTTTSGGPTCGDGVVEDDEECDDGNAVASDGCHQCLVGRVVFVTSTSMTGAIGSLQAADDICNTLAETANLPGTFVAWLSTDITDAASRFAAGIPDSRYIRIDGTIVVDDLADLQDGSLDAPINVDEMGNAVPGRCLAWTNTNQQGMDFGDFDCVNWTSMDIVPGGSIGNCQATDITWNSHGDFLEERCNNAHRLYCFQDEF